MARTRRDGGPQVVVDQHIKAADRLSRNSDFNDIYNRTRTEIIGDIERTKLDGSEGMEKAALEHVRELQSLLSIRRKMLRIVANAEIPAQAAQRKQLAPQVSQRKQRRQSI